MFDTIFTTVSSVTKRLKVYNPYKNPIRIDKIMLAGGKSSPYRINVDGIPGDATEVIIPSKDSIYIFIEVTIDQGNQNTPFIVEDSILFFHNNKTQKVMLVAWGQDAVYYTPNQYIPGLPPFRIIECNTTWTPAKPIVIYGYAVVDSNCTLTIQAGTTIYFHKGSGLWVYRGGRLIATGSKDNPIVFRNDRLDHQYDDIPGQWDRIWINESSQDHILEYVQIRNSFIGLQAETLPFGNDADNVSANALLLKNLRIEHTTVAGILARNYRITGGNVLIADNGQYALLITGGGTYDFTHTTIANYWTHSTRNTPSVFITNEYTDLYGNTHANFTPQFIFKNGIITGSIEKEFDIKAKTGGNIDFQLYHSLIKTTASLSSGISVNNSINPAGAIFTDYAQYNFHLTSSSPAINLGNLSYAQPDWINDLDQNNRTTDGQPDAGCYEYVP